MLSSLPYKYTHAATTFWPFTITEMITDLLKQGKQGFLLLKAKNDYKHFSLTMALLEKNRKESRATSYEANKEMKKK